ncbi:MAG: glycosyltransferase family 2 protein [Thermodesulfobacteriota bacterium]
MDLSVIIVNWNTRQLVVESLQSLYRAIGDFSMEVFVVDNGSSDGSVEAIRAAFPRVILVENAKNIGFARANNEALRRARGKYFLFLNTDVILQEYTVAALLEFMEKTPQAGIVGAQLLNTDGTKQNSFDNFPTLLSEGLNKSLLRMFFPNRFPSKRLSLSSPIAVESVIGACMMVRKDAVDEVGPMDEDYFLFMEETDWCYRMRERGWRVYLVPQAQAVHLQGGTADRVKVQAKLEYYRSRYSFFKKHRGTLQAGVLRGILLLKLSMSLLMHSLLCLFTFFQDRKARQKLANTWKLFAWHLRFCPEGAGLKQ